MIELGIGCGPREFPVPTRGRASRWPNQRELRAALESVPGCSVTYRPNGQGGWDADVVDATRDDAWHATVWTKNTSDDETPIEFSFHKPNLELALLIVEKLSHVCGPFLFVDASSVTPVVVAPGSDPAKLVAQWSAE